jgi:hypothetical protein
MGTALPDLTKIPALSKVHTFGQNRRDEVRLSLMKEGGIAICVTSLQVVSRCAGQQRGDLTEIEQDIG